MKFEKYQKTHEYICAGWCKAVKKGNRDLNFALPFDFIPPCIDNGFIDLFYWDTYFTNLGLYVDGMEKYAYGNIENLKFCLRRFGCVPNVCRADGAKHASQPPLLFLMIKEQYNRSLDKEWLKDSYKVLKTEYAFWQSKRLAPNGLNRYWRNFDCERLGADESWIKWYSGRHGTHIIYLSEVEKIELQTHKTAEGEGGEDHTPRYGGKAADINPIDLNSYLYGFERQMMEFASILANGEVDIWSRRAETRLGLIRKYCYDSDTGVYFDYDYKRKQRTGVYCGACYLPFVFGISNDKGAVEKINEALLYMHGVVSCQNMSSDGDVYQWGYPNSWAPHNWWAYLANKRVGLQTEAVIIAERYCDNVSAEFNKSGKLYEKYDAVVGGKATVNEYETPEMLGWTAGVFSSFLDVLKTWED